MESDDQNKLKKIDEYGLESLESLEEDKIDNRTAKEKINDFFEDFGCLFSLIVLAGISYTGWAIYNHVSEQNKQEALQLAQAEDEAKTLEPLFVQKLLELSPKITTQNAPHAMQAAKHLVLMDQKVNAAALDLLGKKYLELFQKSRDKVSFQEKLINKLDEIYQPNPQILSTDETNEATPPFSVKIQKNENPYIQFALNNQMAHSR